LKFRKFRKKFLNWYFSGEPLWGNPQQNQKSSHRRSCDHCGCCSYNIFCSNNRILYKMRLLQKVLQEAGSRKY
jgi:hypothetical protein